jgi:hypothetical protein
MKKIYKINIEVDTDIQTFEDIEEAIGDFDWELLEEYTINE